MTFGGNRALTKGTTERSKAKDYLGISEWHRHYPSCRQKGFGAWTAGNSQRRHPCSSRSPCSSSPTRESGLHWVSACLWCGSCLHWEPTTYSQLSQARAVELPQHSHPSQAIVGFFVFTSYIGWVAAVWACVFEAVPRWSGCRCPTSRAQGARWSGCAGSPALSVVCGWRLLPATLTQIELLDLPLVDAGDGFYSFFFVAPPMILLACELLSCSDGFWNFSGTDAIMIVLSNYYL